MIKCLFVDIISISSSIPKSKFKQANIEIIADSILTAGGLLRPLILRQIGDRYTVIDGDLAYYAAVRAKEKDLRRAEMVNAFVITDDSESAVIAQLTLLSKTELGGEDRLQKTIADVVTTQSEERSDVAINEQIDRQLTPVHQQLAAIASQIEQHTGMLAELQQQVAKLAQPKPPKSEKLGKQQPEQLPTIAPIVEPAITKPVVIKPPAKTRTAASAAKTKTTKTKTIKASPFADIAPARLADTLNLMNTLELTDLVMRMKKSGITTHAELIASETIAKRAVQPEYKFTSWNALLAVDISKLTPAIALKIIEKLK